MIYGIGVDLVSVKRVARVLERWGDRFVGRVFTQAEAGLCRSRAFPASAFATRFAAKESFSKALGLGMRRGLRWRDIEVFHHPGGRPGLRAHGRSSEICREERITGMHVSLSDDGDYGIAMVVLEREDAAGAIR
ncbi:MAG: holo-ACP synthase [Thermodesulfobacteriota bacterium]